MIKVNGQEIKFGKFPDGTQMKLDFNKELLMAGNCYPSIANIIWLYESDEEMVQLMYVVGHLRANHDAGGRHLCITLALPYVPNARMDRVKDTTEVFTLKYFCEFINSLNFDKVGVLDPHSNVTTALLNNVSVLEPTNFIQDALDDIEGKNIDGGELYGGKTVIYFPDDGAMKRYKSLPCFEGRTIIYGKKNRDWKTGKILGLDVYNERGEKATREDIDGKIVLMIDDIISYGGTLAYSADKLVELGASYVYAYASHTENSVLNEEKGTLLKRLNDRTLAELYTTNSLYSGSHPSITLIKEF